VRPPEAADDLLLVPTPRSVRFLGARVPVPADLSAQTVRQLTIGVIPDNAPPSVGPHIAWHVTGGHWGQSPALRQGYRLRIGAPPAGARAITLEAPTPAGIRHGLHTLTQLLTQYPHHLPALEIDDHPSFATRGVMLDVSRDRVPTMASLFETVDLLVSLKYNHLQLYTEHTFAYAGHEDVWRGWSPITPSEGRELDSYCKDRGIDLAANQNCFGHLASWLRHPKYAHLAETHGDWVFDVWPRSGPFSLCPTDPASLTLIEDLLGQLLPCFSGGLVNIGCDETYDVGFGRSKAQVQARGRAAVYLEFVTKIAAVARTHNKRPMFWADIALSHPEAIADLPEDMIALAWGYEPDSPFERWCELLQGTSVLRTDSSPRPNAPPLRTRSPRETWVCPGTSSWRSITGRTTERRGNLQAAATAGLAGGATGCLVCDWGDTGHHQQWPITAHALAHGAQAAWNAESVHRFDPRASSLHVLNDPTLQVGPWLERFGDADLPLRETCGQLSWSAGPPRLRNQSALFIDMLKKLDEQREVGDPALFHQTTIRLEALAGDLAAITSQSLPPRAFAGGVSRCLASDGGGKRGAPLRGSFSVTPSPPPPITLSSSRGSVERPNTQDTLIPAEFSHSLNVARFAAWRATARREQQTLTPSDRARGRAWIAEIIQEHTRLWRLRSREGGLNHSCGYYRQIADSFA
jgi:hypothetical protein